MNFEGAIIARVKDDAAISAIVAGRVTWSQRTQDSALPAVVLRVIADDRQQDLEGFTTRNTRVQFDCFAATRTATVSLREAVIAAVAPPALVSGVQFQRAIFDPVTDRGESTSTGFVHRDQFDATFRHSG